MSETATAPTRAGDWKNATQSPRPSANETKAMPNRAAVLSTERMSQSNSLAPVMSGILHGMP
jgi:hypothetical protein